MNAKNGKNIVRSKGKAQNTPKRKKTLTLKLVFTWFNTKVFPAYLITLWDLIDKQMFYFNTRLWIGASIGLTYNSLTQRFNPYGFAIAVTGILIFMQDKNVYLTVGTIVLTLFHSLFNEYVFRLNENEKNKRNKKTK